MAQFVGSLARHPARVSFGWYSAGVVIGALLLVHSYCRRPDAEPVSAVDAVFTATSALCVTGLTVRSTGNDFSLLGQGIILLLVQIGGIGIITVSTYVTLRLGGRQSLHKRTLLAETLGTSDEPDLRQVLRRVVRFTFWFELAGAVILTGRFLLDYDVATAVWQGVFHSIAAFCNAGFSLNDNSLMPYQGDWVVNLTVIGLIIIGGIGYPVMIDISRHWHGSLPDCWDCLMLHTKLMLVGTAALVTLGTAAVLVFEWNNALEGMTLPKRLLVALFQSVTTRTAGFNTVNIGTLNDATLFVFILLMLVGAGPGSTAGGFKVSTLVVLILRAWTLFWGSRQVHVARRTIPQVAIDRAITTALLFAVTSIVGLIGLLSIEQFRVTNLVSGELFLDACFEVASALGTVGLSTGMTPHLTTGAKVIIIVLMFIGRLGPITVAAAVARGQREQRITYASEEPLIG